MAMDNSPFISFMDTSFPLCHIWLPDRPWWPWCPRSWSKALISLETEVLFALAVLNLVGTQGGMGEVRAEEMNDTHVWGYYISTFKTWEWWSLLDMFWAWKMFWPHVHTFSPWDILRHLETSWDTHPNTKGSILWGRHQWEVDKNWRGFQVCRRARSTWNSASVTSSRGDQQQRLVEKQSLVSLFGDEKSPKKWKRHVNTKHQNQHFEGPFSPLVLHFWTLATLIFEKMGYGMVVGYQLMDRWFRLKRPKIAVAHNKAFLCWDTWFWYIFWLQENANLVVGFLSSLGFESSNIHINNKPTRFGNLSGTLASKYCLLRYPHNSPYISHVYRPFTLNSRLDRTVEHNVLLCSQRGGSSDTNG